MALGAKRPARPGEPVGRLAFAAAVLGQGLSRGKGKDQFAGAFTSDPKGDWIATKLFLEESEVFLNLDPVSGYGEIAVKDPEYAEGVLRELGRVLLGEAPPPSGAKDSSPTVPAVEPAAPVDPAVNRFVEVLRDPAASQAQRVNALTGLGQMKLRAHAAIPYVLVALRDPDPIIRSVGLDVIRVVGVEPEQGRNAVTPCLKDEQGTNRAKAAYALHEFGDSLAAVTYLTVALKGEERVPAAIFLGKIGPAARSAVPHLAQMLEGRRDREEGYYAAAALGAIGTDAVAALPALEAAARDPDSYVSGAARGALARMKAPQ